MLDTTWQTFLRSATGLALWRQGARQRTHQVGSFEVVTHHLGESGDEREEWLLLHGLGTTALTWAPVLPALRGCRVLIPELSEIGGTQGPQPGLDLSEGTERMAEFIWEHLDPPVTLAGFSLGGWLAVRLTLDHPELVERLVVINSAGYRNQDWKRLEQLVRVERLGDGAALLDALMKTPPWPRPLAQTGVYLSYRSAAVRSVLDRLTEADVFGDDDLGRIDQPVGVVWSEDDTLFPLSVAEAMCRALPQASLQTLPGCGHAAHWERPRELAAAVASFRQRHPAERLDARSPTS